MNTMKKVLFILSIFLIISCGSGKNLLKESTNVNEFSDAELEMITGLADEAMRVFLITNTQDSILLRQKSEMVIPNPNDVKLKLFTDRLLATVKDSMHMGVGIAAPQVGVLKNIIWIQRFDKKDFPFEVYLNPIIKQYSKKKQPCPEGCLSIPDKRGTTKNRAYAILLEYDKMNGEHVTEMVEDFTAVIFQHEIDHLNGIMFTDHLEEDIKSEKKN